MASVEVEVAIGHHVCEQSIGDRSTHAMPDYINLGVRVKFQVFDDLYFQSGYQLTDGMGERFLAAIG